MHIKKKFIIEVENLHYSYNENIVLENISFAVEKGEYLALIGPNGSGKTTLLKILLGLLKPDSGSVTILGKNIQRLKNRSAQGYVPQRSAYSDTPFPATVEEIVRSGRTARLGLLRRFGKSDFKAVEEALEMSDILDLRKRLIYNLSGGQRQRVFIARALAGEPQLLFLDEPMTGVDVGAQKKFYDFLSNLNKNFGITIIVVSHDIEVVTNEVKSVLCLNRKLVCHTSPKDFMKDEYLEILYGKKVKLVRHGH